MNTAKGPLDPHVQKELDEIAHELKASGPMGTHVDNMSIVSISFGSFLNFIWATREVLRLRERVAQLEKRFE